MTKESEICAYCGESASEREHVIARQFFPPEQRYRGDLILVPACGTCNREKQFVEDVTGVLIPFTGHGDASKNLLLDRIPRTLAKNKRLADSIKGSLKTKYYIDPNGKFQKKIVLELTSDNTQNLKSWYEFIIKGLYRYEFKRRLEVDQEIYLLWPQDESQAEYWYGWLSGRIGARSAKRAYGEVIYSYAAGIDAVSSSWYVIIHGARVVAITANVTDAVLCEQLEEIRWK